MGWHRLDSWLIWHRGKLQFHVFQMTVSLERRAVGVCEWAGNRDGLRCVVSGGGNDVYSALTWWKVLSPWSFIDSQSSSGRWIGSLLPHCWSDWEPGWVPDVAQRSAGNPQGQDLALVPLSHDCLSVFLSPAWGWRQSRSQKLDSCSDFTTPHSWTWVLSKRQGWYHLILLICGTWENGTYLQNRNRVTDVENKLMVTKGERRGGMNQEIGIDRYDTTL